MQGDMSPSLETSSKTDQPTVSNRSGGFGVSKIGKCAASLIVLMVVVQFAIVVFRYLFGLNFIWAQEFVLALHGTSFMLVAPWVMLQMRHVRIDVFSERFSSRTRSKINLFGFILLLLPMMIAIFASSFNYVVEAWSVLEGSAELSGLPGKFLLKTIIPVFALLMILAGWAALRKDNGSGVNSPELERK